MHSFWTEIFEGIVAGLAALTAIGYTIMRLYKIARSIELILAHAEDEKKHRTDIAKALTDHITMEDTRDRTRDIQFARMDVTIEEIKREVTPNGGSSMKDVLNRVSRQVADTHERLAVVEEWKRAATAKDY